MSTLIISDYLENKLIDHMSLSNSEVTSDTQVEPESQ